MTANERLTLEEIEQIIADFDDGKYLFNVLHYKQLADLLRENAELKKYPLKLICEKCGVFTETNPAKDE